MLEGPEYIVRKSDQYRSSLRILSMAEHVHDQVGNYDMIRDEVDILAEEYGKVSYLYKASGERVVEMASSVGAQQPIYTTALGKTILTFPSPERAEGIVDSTEFVSHTVTSRE